MPRAFPPCPTMGGVDRVAGSSPVWHQRSFPVRLSSATMKSLPPRWSRRAARARCLRPKSCASACRRGLSPTGDGLSCRSNTARTSRSRRSRGRDGGHRAHLLARGLWPERLPGLPVGKKMTNCTGVAGFSRHLPPTAGLRRGWCLGLGRGSVVRLCGFDRSEDENPNCPPDPRGLMLRRLGSSPVSRT